MSARPEDVKTMSSLLFQKYKKIALSPTEAAQAIGRTEDALKKDRQNAQGIPYTRTNNKQNGKPLYTITTIARHLLDNEVKVI